MRFPLFLCLALATACTTTTTTEQPGGDGDGDGQNSGDGDGTNPGDGDGDGANPGDGDGANPGDGDGDGTEVPDPDAGMDGMLPDEIDPTKPETIPKDPEPGNDTENEKVLRLSVRFYGAQRCGDGGNYLLYGNENGEQCHMRDGEAVGKDMTGGWHDAGDFIKFTLTNAWSSYALLKIYDVFPDAFDDQYGARHEPTGNGVPDLLDQAKYAVDYLVKLNPSPDTLIARIAGDQDHGGFVTSPTQSTWNEDMGGGARPVDPNGQAGADIAGITAASLAMMSRLWKAYDADRAAVYLDHAKQVYALGDSRQRVTPDNFYGDDTFEDDMLCGAIELYRASGDPKYYSDAVKWDDAVNAHGWVVDWSNTTDYCRHSLVQVGSDDTLGYWKEDVASYLAAVSRDPFVNGLAWFGDWGTLRYATGAGLSAALLYDVTGDVQYRTFAESQLAYVLGENEYNRSFLIGYGNNPPRNPHHRNAYGYDWFDPNMGPRLSLDGALVGGPTKADTEVSQAGYQDNIGNYVGNEVTTDYNTGLVGLAAFSVAHERRN